MTSKGKFWDSPRITQKEIWGLSQNFPNLQKKKGKKMKEQKFDDQVEGRNSVLELLESGKDINKIYVTRGEKHGSINKILAIARERKIIIVEKDKKTNG